MSDLLSGRVVGLAAGVAAVWWPITTHSPTAGAVVAGAAAVAVAATTSTPGRRRRRRWGGGGHGGPGRGGIGPVPPWPGGPQGPDDPDQPRRVPVTVVDLRSVPVPHRRVGEATRLDEDVFTAWEREFAQPAPTTDHVPAHEATGDSTGTGGTR